MFRFGKIANTIFVCLGILFIPFPFHLFPFQEKITVFIFRNLLELIHNLLFGDNQYKEISSDSTYLYTLVVILILFSILISLLILLKKVPKKIELKFYEFSHILISYYLSLQLLKYGFEKIIRSQFYIPEPNTLYTPLGFLDKDILFWSTIGSSHSYAVFLGIAQIIPAVLLLFYRTRFVGLLISIIVFSNIVAINFSFDISVKIYTFFLLILSIIGFSKYFSIIYTIATKKIVNLNLKRKSNFNLNPFVYTFSKSLVVLLLFFEVLYPAIQANNFNNDTSERPFLHGAYKVVEMLENGVTVTDNKLKRVFIHKMDYFIFQYQNDTMQDYKLELNQIKNQFVLTNYNLKQTTIDYKYSSKDSLLTLKYKMDDTTYQIKTKQLNWKALPLLQHNFHWTIEGIE